MTERPSQRLDRSIIEGEAITMLRAAVKSKYTLDPYERRLIHFLNWYGKNAEGLVADGKENPSTLERKIIRFIVEKKKDADEKKIVPATISGYIKALKLLLEMNDVSLNWKKIRRTLPAIRRFALDRAPTYEEVRSIVENADMRGKALTLIFASSGIREGAIELAKVGHYTEVRDEDKQLVAGRLIVYPGEQDQYIAFTTPEAWITYQEYLKFRKMHGEQITDESPLFRDKFDPKIHNTDVRKPKSTNGPAIRRYYNDLFRALGFRSGFKRRHEFSIHGFRKYFKTKAELAGVRPINVEILMGHSVGVSDSYYRPTETDLLEDYKKAIAHLTHLSATMDKQLVEQVERLKADNAKIESLASDNAALNKKLTDLYKYLYDQGLIRPKEPASAGSIPVAKRKRTRKSVD